MEIKKELELEETKNTELNDDELDTVSGGLGLIKDDPQVECESVDRTIY